MSVVFADTFYFIALLSPQDAHHERARRISRELRCRVVSTSWVLTEVADALSEPANRHLAAQLRQIVIESQFIRIIPANEELWQSGFDLFEARPDKEWSLTDCISFIVMERERVTEALTGDHHFEQAGFKALLKD